MNISDLSIQQNNDNNDNNDNSKQITFVNEEGHIIYSEQLQQKPQYVSNEGIEGEIMEDEIVEGEIMEGKIVEGEIMEDESEEDENVEGESEEEMKEIIKKFDKEQTEIYEELLKMNNNLDLNYGICYDKSEM